MFTLKIQYYEESEVYELQLHEENQNNYHILCTAVNRYKIQVEFQRAFKNIRTDWFECILFNTQQSWFAVFKPIKELSLESKESKL